MSVPTISTAYQSTSFVSRVVQHRAFRAPRTNNEILSRLALRTILFPCLASTVGLTGFLWHSTRSIGYITLSAIKKNRHYFNQGKSHAKTAAKDLKNGAFFGLNEAGILVTITVAAVTLPFFLGTQFIKMLLPKIRIFQFPLGILAFIEISLISANLFATTLFVKRIEQKIQQLQPNEISCLTMVSNLTQQSKMWQIKVKREELKTAPEKILKRLGNDQQQMQSKRLRVIYLDKLNQRMAGIDAGGLSRDFISGLMEGLATKANQRETFSFEEVNGSWLPLLKNKKEISGYRTIGKFLGISYENRYVTGQVFSASMFDMLSLLTPADVEREKLSKETYLRLYHQKNLSTKTIAQMFRYLDTPFKDLEEKDLKQTNLKSSLYMIDKEAINAKFLDEEENVDTAKLSEDYTLFQKEIKALLLSYAKDDKSLPAVHAIGQGIFYHMDQDRSRWCNLIAQGGAALNLKFQGDLTKSLLLDRLSISDQTIKRFFRKWIDTTSIDLLKDFVKAVTGTPALGSSNIHIRILRGRESRNRLPSFHTCFNSMDVVSYRAEDYQLFKKKLEQAIQEGLKEGFSQV